MFFYQFSILDFFSVRPLIKLSMTSKHLFIGNSISVRCNVSGDPYPYINWYKISQGKKNILNHKSPLLNFDQVEKGDQGKYICEAQNDVGLAHATFDLKVTGQLKLTYLKCGRILSCLSAEVYYFFL